MFRLNVSAMRLILGVLSLSQLGQGANPEPITGSERAKWVLSSTLGVTSMASGVVTSAWGTARNSPEEYGPHWAGFGKRYGMRLSGVATRNVMEAGLGHLFHEDPRYHRAGGSPFKQRIGNVVKGAFLTRGRKDQWTPAYASYAAISGSNFLSNAWRPDSHATTQRALVRTSFGFLSKLASNAFAEFWPDIRSRGRH